VKRRGFLTGALAVLATASIAFAGHTGTTLRMAITQDEGTLTPYTYQTGYPGYELMTLIYDTLFLMDADLQPQPWLAADTQISEDGLTYTVTLKDGLVWQDGEPLTAADVAFTIQYFKDNLLGRFTTAATKVSAVETPDARTAVLTLDAVDATFLTNSLTDIPILPQHVWSDVTVPDTMEQPMGSGPYMLTEYRTDQFYRLVENPNFWGPAPAVDEIIAPVIRDQTATFQALQAGEIDVAVRNVSPELVDRFAARDDLEVAQGPGFASTILVMDVTQGALADPGVRQVLAGLIDYNRLIDNLLLGFGASGPPGFLPPASPVGNPATQEYTLLTPEDAQARLEELGFSRNGEGVYVDGDGNELAFEFLTYSDNPIRLRAAELIAQDLEAGGIDITIRTMEREALVERVWPGFDVSQGRSYQLSMFGWSAPVAAQARLGALMHSDPSIGNLNLSGYSDPDADRLIEQAAVTTDEEARRELLFDLQEIMARDLPLITLFYQDGVYAYRPAAFDDWTFMAGQGIINKNSFVTE
jgi:peptide/nickel transport system substrate-binding protein